MKHCGAMKAASFQEGGFPVRSKSGPLCFVPEVRGVFRNRDLPSISEVTKGNSDSLS